jgi:hypothetical protein
VAAIPATGQWAAFGGAAGNWGIFLRNSPLFLFSFSAFLFNCLNDSIFRFGFVLQRFVGSVFSFGG